MSGQNSNNSITVTRQIDASSSGIPSPKIPFAQCCPGVWIEAAILAVIVIALVAGFIKSVKNFKD